jgi:hypothetical protein
MAKSFTTLRNYAGSLSQNTSSANLTLFDQLINDTHKYLLQKYFFNEASTTIRTNYQTQFYDLPFDYSKLKTSTITIGDLKWTPTEVLTRIEWDRLNVFPYYSDIPNNFFIYNNQLGFWPIPSANALTFTAQTGNFTDGLTITGATSGATAVISSQVDNGTTGTLSLTTVVGIFISGELITDTSTGSATVDEPVGNTITFNYKRRVPDLSFADYTTGTVTVTNDSTTITGAGTGFLANYLTSAGSVLRLNLWIKVTQPKGDGEWYQISSITDATTLTLVKPYQGETSAGANFTIGQMPLLLEDYHDLLVYRPLMIYFSTIVDNPTKKKEFEDFYNEGIARLDSYAGSKTVNVNLRGAIRSINPNLFPQNLG